MSVLAIAEDRIWELLCSDEPDWEAILDVIRDAELEAEAHRHDPDCAAAVGYFWYLLPGEEPERLDAGTQWLRHALTLAPEHPLAHLYLAHFAYDRGDMTEALTHLRAVPVGHYRARGQVWREIKLRELVLAAGLRQREPDELGIVRFLAEYDATPDEDCVRTIELVDAAELVRHEAVTAAVAERILRWAHVRED